MEESLSKIRVRRRGGCRITVRVGGRVRGRVWGRSRGSLRVRARISVRGRVRVRIRDLLEWRVAIRSLSRLSSPKPHSLMRARDAEWAADDCSLEV